MTRIIQTNSENQNFIDLVKKLDADLAIRDGDDHDFYHQFNSIDKLNQVVILYKNDIAIGCGALKHYELNIVEIKRMYVLPEHRGFGYASIILKELERWALKLNIEKCILETGVMQPEAIALYIKNGYLRIVNYGPYKDVENSYCFEKIINKSSL